MEPQLGSELCPSCLDTKSQITTGNWKMCVVSDFPGEFPDVAGDRECGRRLALLRTAVTANKKFSDTLL